MRAHLTYTAAVSVLSVLLIGCGDPNRPSETRAAESETTEERDAVAVVRRITMMDACDPTTFNAAIGPGTCVNRRGGVTFENFIAQLTRNQKVGSWHNAPPSTTARQGQTLVALNRGGEVHTFTRVQAFGGGLIPILNQLSGNPLVAPECTALGPGDFVPPGGTDEVEVGAASTQQFMCCLHPWMRTTVHTH